MGIYFFVVLFSFLSFLYFYRRPNNIGYNIVFTVIAFIICFGYMCGSDWRNYESLYNVYATSEDDFWWRFLYVEPLYLLLNVIGNELHLDFWVFYYLIKILIYIKIVQIFKRFCPKEIVLLAFTFYLGFWGIVNFIDPSFRNMIAAFFFLCSIDSLINKKIKTYFLWVIVATLFHYSSIILFFFYFILNKEYSTKSIVVLFIVANIILIKPELIFKVASLAFSFVPAIAYKIDNYTLGEEASTMGQGKLLSLGYLIHVTIFVLILYFRKRIEELENGKLLFNMSVFFVFVFRIGLTVLIFSRLQLFIAYFYSITVAYLMYSFVKRDRLIYISFILAISLFSTMNQMRNVYMVPYTNYFMYIEKNMTFEERANYNFKYSPYRDIGR